MSRLPFAPPIDEITVDVTTGKLRFFLREGTAFDAALLRKAIEDAGYGVADVALDGKPLPLSEPTGDASKGARDAHKDRRSQP